MPKVVEEIPQELKPAAEAALAWINRERGANFKITGIVDPDRVLADADERSIELGLVLCEGDLCLREQVRVESTGAGFEVNAIESEAPAIPAHLDPPVGVRRGWLDQQLERHAFIVLLFYRGLW